MRRILVLVLWLVVSGAKGPKYGAQVHEVRAQAERGDATAQKQLSVMYHNGHGVPQDAAQAIPWVRKAAEHSLATAQAQLGRMYANGWGVPQDVVLVYLWTTLAVAKLTSPERGTAEKLRTELASQMTRAPRAETRHRARTWKQRQK